MQAMIPRHLKLLEKLLFALPGEPMLVSEFDGFLAGILVCPDLIMPGEWLPIVWGADEDDPPVFATEQQARKITELIMEHYNSIARALRRGRGEYAAIFDFDPRNDETLWEIWIDGFARAMDLRPESWAAIPVTDADARAALAGMVALIEISARESPRPQEEIDDLVRTAHDLIPGWVEDLHAWRISQNFAAQPMPAMPKVGKVGRNDSCPCGSGKKYKKCCGQN